MNRLCETLCEKSYYILNLPVMAGFSIFDCNSVAYSTFAFQCGQMNCIFTALSDLQSFILESSRTFKDL